MSMVFLGLLLLLQSPPSEADVEPPLLLEIVDARGVTSPLPVFAPPRERYLLMPPVPTGHAPHTRVDNLKSLGVRTFRRGHRVVADVFLLLRDVPDQELAVETHELEPGQSVTTTGLGRYGLERLTLTARMAPVVTAAAPPVENASRSLKAEVSVVPGAIPLYRVVLRNIDGSRGVYAVAMALEVIPGPVTRAPRSRRGRPLIPPSGTHVTGFHGQGDFIDGRFVVREARRVRIDAVVFDDGTFEGDRRRARELLAWRATEAWQVARLLSQLEPVAQSPEPVSRQRLSSLHAAVADAGRRMGLAELEDVLARCAECHDERPAALRHMARLTTDEILQDLEALVADEGPDEASLRAGLERIVDALAAWREAVVRTAEPVSVRPD